MRVLGRLKTITQAARELGTPMPTLRQRLIRKGAPIWRLGHYTLVLDEDAMAVTQEAKKPPKGVEVFSESYND
jgi:hypothetical protein